MMIIDIKDYGEMNDDYNVRINGKDFLLLVKDCKEYETNESTVLGAFFLFIYSFNICHNNNF